MCSLTLLALKEPFETTDRKRSSRCQLRSSSVGRRIDFQQPLLHDLVEIDVGDVPIHSANGQAHASEATQAAEAQAAERIFGLLPKDLSTDLHTLWQEFEAAETLDAVFAKSLDRVQPVMANLMSGGGTWIEYSVTSDHLDQRVGVKIARGAPRLWDWVRAKTRTYFRTE